MIPLKMVVGDVFVRGTSKMTFATWDDPVQAFFLDGSHKSFGMCIPVRGLIRRLHDPNPSLLEPFANRRAPFRIPIADQHANAPKADDAAPSRAGPDTNL
jgi:hypothetical protein